MQQKQASKQRFSAEFTGWMELALAKVNFISDYVPLSLQKFNLNSEPQFCLFCVRYMDEMEYFTVNFGKIEPLPSDSTSVLQNRQ